MKPRTSRSAGIFTIFLVAQLGACAAPQSSSNQAVAASSDGTFFVEHGSGEPVVLVHGFSQTHAAWLSTPLFAELVRGYRVIAVDLRGHGDSDKPHEPTLYGPNLHSDLIGVLDELDVDRAHFVGFSLGASVVGDLLVSRPERVQTATLGSGFFTAWDEHEEDFATLIENRQSSEHRDPWEPANQDYRALAALVRGARYSVVSEEQIALVQTPTLVVFGSAEIATMSELQRQRLESAPESMTVLIVDGADHQSDRAAVLSREFVEAVRELIGANPIR